MLDVDFTHQIQLVRDAGEDFDLRFTVYDIQAPLPPGDKPPLKFEERLGVVSLPGLNRHIMSEISAATPIQHRVMSADNDHFPLEKAYLTMRLNVPDSALALSQAAAEAEANVAAPVPVPTVVEAKAEPKPAEPEPAAAAAPTAAAAEPVPEAVVVEEEEEHYDDEFEPVNSERAQSQSQRSKTPAEDKPAPQAEAVPESPKATAAPVESERQEAQPEQSELQQHQHQQSELKRKPSDVLADLGLTDKQKSDEIVDEALEVAPDKVRHYMLLLLLLLTLVLHADR